MMCNELTQEQVQELFDYDSDNGWLIRKKDEYGRVVNRPCGNKPNRSHGYGAVRIDEKMHLAHRVIWLLVYGSWPEFIDHLDRDRMNNRIENLRAATRNENNHNRGLQCNNSSGYPGVSWAKHVKKYVAKIRDNNKLIHLGYYTTAEEAFEAYKRAKIKYHPSSPIAQQYLQELPYAS